MRLVVVVVAGRSAPALQEALGEAGFGATLIQSSGGFLRQGNTTFFLGVEEDRVDALLDVVRESAPATTEDHPAGEQTRVGTTIFVVPVVTFDKC